MASAKSYPQRAGLHLKNRVTLADAQRSGRCLCEGCDVCRGLAGYPCGQGGIGLGALKCSHCMRGGPRK